MEKRDINGLTEAEFLAQYNPGDYERPSVTVDIAVMRMKKDLSCLQVLLIKRGGHPDLGKFSLPGGFVNIDESGYSAAIRELKEETNVDACFLDQIYTMTQPNRDKRMRIIDIAYMGLLPYEEVVDVKANDDADDAKWFDLFFMEDKIKLVNDEINVEIEYALEKKVFKNGCIQIENFVPHLVSEEALAFDHSEIILECLMKLRDKVMLSDVAFNLVKKEFTLPDLQKVYEVILGKELYKANFRDKIESKVVKLDKTGKPLTSKKPAQLYKYKGC